MSLKKRLVALLCVAIAVEAVFLAVFSLQFAAYQELAGEVNMRWSMPDPRVFIVPNDPAVQSVVRAVTYGNINPADEHVLRLYLKILYDWVSANIRPRSDSPYPMLPRSPLGGKTSFVDEVWQFPNETLALRGGDCEDSATLLLSMVRFYSPRLRSACLVVEGERGAHAAIMVSKGGNVAILDPGLYYYTRDRAGLLTFKPLITELESWLPLVEKRTGVGVCITTLFTEAELARFKNTGEFIAYFHMRFKG